MFSLTLVHASVLVLEYSELVNFAKFLKHRPQGVLFEMARYLSDKEFDGAISIAGGWRGRDRYQHFYLPRCALATKLLVSKLGGSRCRRPWSFLARRSRSIVLESSTCFWSKRVFAITCRVAHKLRPRAKSVGN